MMPQATPDLPPRSAPEAPSEAPSEAASETQPGLAPETQPAALAGWAVSLAWIEQGRAVCQTVVVNVGPDGPLSLRQLLASAEVRRLLPAGLLASDHGLASFGRRRRPDEPVRAGERIEILPPLLADPKQARRSRVDARRQQQGREGRDRWHTNRQPG